MKYISSRNNENIKRIIKLKNKKYRYIEKRFIIEGQKLLDEAIKCGCLVDKLYMAEKNKARFDEYVKLLPDTEKYVLADTVFNNIADTETPQGILAVVHLPDYNLELLLARKSLLLLLDRLSDPGNLGTIIRTAWALEIDGILLTKGCVDPFNPKTVRATMGGIFQLPIIVDIGEQELFKLKHNGYRLMCSALDAEATIDTRELTGACVIIIGSEAHGVSDEIKLICDESFLIPMNTSADSLNAAVACGIIAYEAMKQRRSTLCLKSRGML